eukprot:scaffold2963_cov250-Pinguiococcus_pyrenoidosus.AAC.7
MMCFSQGTGRSSGLKLKNPRGATVSDVCSGRPSQSPRSPAFANAVDNPMSRIPPRPEGPCRQSARSVLASPWPLRRARSCRSRATPMYLMRETMTSSTGPRSVPRRWISSIITRLTSCTYRRLRHPRDTPSHFSGVVTMMSAASSCRGVAVESPVSSSTLRPRPPPSLRFQSFSLSRARAFSGATYTHFARAARPLMLAERATRLLFSIRKIAISEIAVFPEPVGAPSSTVCVAVQLLVVRVPEGRQRQRRQVHETRVLQTPLWQHKVIEVHRNRIVHADPALTDRANDVVRRRWFKEREHEDQDVLLPLDRVVS